MTTIRIEAERLVATAQASSRGIFLHEQEDMDVLRFITCGSVDDGKSTLIGRLLWESSQVLEDQVAALRKDSARYGTQGDNLDFALLVDGLSAEREQGITIDVAYRYFTTAKRRFVVADTPGHEQYTRNMVTGASTAQLAVILIDARHGVLTQTRRHAFLTSLAGIRHVALAVNKLDLVDYDERVFDRITEQFRTFVAGMGFASITALPVSALTGANIFERSAMTPWYSGPSLMHYLEQVDVGRSCGSSLVFPVQRINRPDSGFRGLAGTIVQGRVRPGDELRVAASGQLARVARIVTYDGDLDEAIAGQAVTLTLDREIDSSRGDVLSAANEPLILSDQFEATIVWLAEDAGLPGRNYELKLLTQTAKASITAIRHRVDVNTLEEQAARSLQLNDICVCHVATSRPLALASFKEIAELGAFILIDRFNSATVAAGMIHHSLRRASNVHRQPLSIRRPEREALNGHRSQVVWLTGLSGAGKSAIANALEVLLHQQGVRTYILDGDNLRHGLNRDLGFTDPDRVENMRRVAETSRLLLDAGLVVIVSLISPFERERAMARERIGEESFLEVYVSTPLEVCEARDVKGLYRKARTGELPNLSGLGSPYEKPAHPELVIDTSTEPLPTSVDRLMKQVLGRIRKD